MDRHGKLFKLGAKVVGPYGTAGVAKMEKVTDGPRYIWLVNARKGPHRVRATEVVKI